MDHALLKRLAVSLATLSLALASCRDGDRRGTSSVHPDPFSQCWRSADGATTLHLSRPAAGLPQYTSSLFGSGYWARESDTVLSLLSAGLVPTTLEAVFQGDDLVVSWREKGSCKSAKLESYTCPGQ